MKEFTVTIRREENIYVAQCVEMDVVSQGETREESLSNLKEAIELVFELGDKSEILRRLDAGASVATLKVAA
jgi:predicted RNase H-like HicB family nuclease